MGQSALVDSEHRHADGGDPLLLVVEDDDVLRLLLVHVLQGQGYTVLEASNGRQALALIRENKDRLQTVVLDRNMPEMGGMNVVALMNESRELRSLPVIMVTAAGRPEEIEEGIKAGVFYYLTKPVDMGVLVSVVSAACREISQHRTLVKELAEHRAGFQIIESCRFKLRTLAEADTMAGLLANSFPDAERVVSGLAELMYNAIEHGNLGIFYHEKTALIERGVWREEIIRRLELPEHKTKDIEVTFRREPQGCYVTVADRGKGFRWREYLYIDSSRARDNHGRGIAQANMVNFDGLAYNDVGNQVTAFSANAAQLGWR